MISSTTATKVTTAPRINPRTSISQHRRQGQFSQQINPEDVVSSTPDPDVPFPDYDEPAVPDVGAVVLTVDETVDVTTGVAVPSSLLV